VRQNEVLCNYNSLDWIFVEEKQKKMTPLTHRPHIVFVSVPNDIKASALEAYSATSLIDVPIRERNIESQPKKRIYRLVFNGKPSFKSRNICYIHNRWQHLL